jgi:hypothetical protein
LHLQHQLRIGGKVNIIEFLEIFYKSLQIRILEQQSFIKKSSDYKFISSCPEVK